jgi:hypothetical protein
MLSYDEWPRDDSAIEAQWKSIWNSFLRVSSSVSIAPLGERLPVEVLIPIARANEFSRFVNTCVDRSETLKTQYAAQFTLINNEPWSSSSSFAALDIVDPGSISDYGTPVNTPANPSSLPPGYQLRYGNPIYDRNPVDTCLTLSSDIERCKPESALTPLHSCPGAVMS